MDGTIRIRHIKDIWWSELPMNETLRWVSFIIVHKDDERCFVLVNNEKMEMSIDSYNKVMDNKIFKIRFDIKKHSLNTNNERIN